MSWVRNPSAFDLYCHPLGRSLRPGEAAPVTPEQEAKLTLHVFVVESDEPPKPNATRASMKRGGAVVEVSASPEVETR